MKTKLSNKAKMNSINLNILFENKNLTFKVKTSNIKLSCKHLVEIIVKRLEKLNKVHSTENYGFFSRLNGVEQLINDHEDILSLESLSNRLLVLRQKTHFECNPIKPISFKSIRKIQSFYSKQHKPMKLNNRSACKKESIFLCRYKYKSIEKVYKQEMFNNIQINKMELVFTEKIYILN